MWQLHSLHISNEGKQYLTQKHIKVPFDTHIPVNAILGHALAQVYKLVVTFGVRGSMFSLVCNNTNNVVMITVLKTETNVRVLRLL